ICGGREYDDTDGMKAVLDSLHKRYCFISVIHGGACGADTMAGKWAASRNIPVTVFNPEWEKYRSKARSPISLSDSPVAQAPPYGQDCEGRRLQRPAHGTTYDDIAKCLSVGKAKVSEWLARTVSFRSTIPRQCGI